MPTTFLLGAFLVSQTVSAFGVSIVVDLDGRIVADVHAFSVAAAESKANAETFAACGAEVFS